MLAISQVLPVQKLDVPDPNPEFNDVCYNSEHLQVCAKKISSASAEVHKQKIAFWRDSLKDCKFKVSFFESKDPIFIIDSSPNVIFKMDKSRTKAVFNGSLPCFGTDERFNNYTNAVSVVNDAALDRLVIPKTQKLCSEKTSFRNVIMEEKLEFNTDFEAQKLTFKSDDPELDEAIKQLALFIIKTGYCDVKAMNNPVIEKDGIKKIALLDLEHCYRDYRLTQRQGIYAGIFGGDLVTTNIGLINMLGPRQAKIVFDIASEHLPFLYENDKKIAAAAMAQSTSTSSKLILSSG